MIFSEHPLDCAEGVYLAHRVRCGDRVFKKGAVLTNEDIVLMRDSGMLTVLGARLEANEVPEETAAVRIAEIMSGPGIEIRSTNTGRCNMHSTQHGVAVIDAAEVDRINLSSEAIAVATVYPWAAINSGDVVASVKIIPFSVPAQTLDGLAAVMRATKPLSVVPFVSQRVALVVTESEFIQEHVVDRTIQATIQRVASVGSTLDFVLTCRHEISEIKDALQQAIASGCNLILVSGASVTKDRNDLIPKAVSEAGGAILHFGMPVKPGNMLLMAELNGIPVLCVPGCARSARENGLDWVLRRLAAKLTITPRDIMLMGVGGLIDRNKNNYSHEKK